MATVSGPLPRTSREVPPRAGLRVGHEVRVLLAAAAVYFGVRVVVEGSAARATRNAERLIELEQTLGIDAERSIQQFALDHDVVRVLGNWSYVWLHWPLLLIALFLLFQIDQRHYLQLRNAMFASGLAGLVLFTILPMAPPRFMPGFVGTVSDEARRHYLTYPLSWTNRFAAFPSFHVGWTLIACVAVAASLRQEHLRWLALIPAGLVGIAVITTGNHYVIDSVVGAAIAGTAYVVFGRRLHGPRTDTDRRGAEEPVVDVAEPSPG